MALLEYATLTVPDVVAKSVLAFFNKDPLLRRMRERNQVKRSGGTHVRVVRIKSGHSDVVQIDESNMSVPLNKKETLSPMTGDWAKYIKPLIIPHFDRDRMQSKDDKKRYVQSMVRAAMQDLKNDFSRRLYVGNITALRGFGTLNNAATVTGTSSGFTNGALDFQVPASQSDTYLNETRNYDSTNQVDHWFNQYVAHNGIGTDFLATAEEIKITADTFAEDDEGISIGIMSIADHVALGDEVRTYGGSLNMLQYSVADLEQGKAHPTVWIVNGVQYYPNRWMNATDVGKTEAAYLLNPNCCEWWVNAGNDFRTTPFRDHLETSNQDADVGYIICEVQFCLPNLMANGCTDNPP